MPDAIWIDRGEELPALARTLESHASIGVDTEFLRERTFFPKLCLLQLAAGDDVWCVDTLRVGGLEPLVPALTAAASRKVMHSARQDLEAFYLSVKRVISPVFDTQIAAGLHRSEAPDRLRGSGEDAAGRDLAQGSDPHRLVEAPAHARHSSSTRPTMCCTWHELAASLERAAARARARAMGVAGLSGARESAGSTSPIPSRRGSGCAASTSCRPAARSRARALAVWREKTGARARSAARLDHHRCGALQARRAQSRDSRGARGGALAAGESERRACRKPARGAARGCRAAGGGRRAG